MPLWYRAFFCCARSFNFLLSLISSGFQRFFHNFSTIFLTFCSGTFFSAASQTQTGVEGGFYQHCASQSQTLQALFSLAHRGFLPQGG
jgi:hypothetical protein